MNTYPSSSATLFLICQSPADLKLLEILGEENLAFSEVYAFYDPEAFLEGFHAWRGEDAAGREDAQAFILLDSGLPMEGASYLLDHLRATYSPAELPVVLLASAMYPNSPHLDLPPGVNEVLELPCSLTELQISLGQCFSTHLA